MEPQLENPHFTEAPKPEKANSAEKAPNAVAPALEAQPSQPLEELKSVESFEQRHGVASNAAAVASTLPAVMPTPVVTDDTATQALPTATHANDDDVIEKEWVNKSKKIVKETKGDPYRKEHEVSKLQADYMHKRYGKQVKIPDDV